MINIHAAPKGFSICIVCGNKIHTSEIEVGTDEETHFVILCDKCIDELENKLNNYMR